MNTKDILDILKRYLELVETDDFHRHREELGRYFKNILKEGYDLGKREDEIVEDIVNALKGLRDFEVSKFSISTNSIFIHGAHNSVEFEYYGEKIKKELGDLIFILSVVYNDKKYFEKLTISQAKKSNKNKNTLSWDIDKGQLYLLSRFPKFKGIRGLIPKKEFILYDYCKCLGSYTLFYNPGDFVFISAPKLEDIIKHKKSVNTKDLSNFRMSYNCFVQNLFCLCLIDPDFFYSYYRWIFRYFRYCFYAPYSKCVLGFCHYSHNVDDFVDKYLRGCIGELIYSPVGLYNKNALNLLRMLLKAVKEKAEGDNDEKTLKFIENFYKYPYINDGNGGTGDEGLGDFDFEGGGIGIIHTIINLGEVKE